MFVAEIAQLVEHNLAKVGVASSSLVFRSTQKPRWRNGRRARFRCVCREACRFESCSGHALLFVYSWRDGGVSFSSPDIAEIAQLVEHNLAKVGVASSSLVFRSMQKPRWRNGRRARFRCVCREACRFESCSGH